MSNIFLTSPWNMTAPYAHDQCSIDWQRHCGHSQGCASPTYVWLPRDTTIDQRHFPYQSQVSRFPLRNIRQFAVPVAAPPTPLFC